MRHRVQTGNPCGGPAPTLKRSVYAIRRGQWLYLAASKRFVHTLGGKLETMERKVLIIALLVAYAVVSRAFVSHAFGQLTWGRSRLPLVELPQTRVTPSLKKPASRGGLQMMAAGSAADPTFLISISRDFVSSGFGVADPTLLSDSKFSGSGLMFKVNKQRYLSALGQESAAFRRAMPDFEFRPYDFEVDPVKPNTVWFKIRPKGTLTGPFSFKGVVYLPNKSVVEMPVQLCSVTVENSKITGVTAGYVMDRYTGNTGGYPGAFGVLFVLGYPPSKFDFFPPASVVRQFFGRTRKVRPFPTYPPTIT